MEPNTEQSVELGLSLGRGQAFGLVANQCLASQAECLRTLRESQSYKSLGLNWEQFCRQHAGFSRARVDALIQQLEELGKTYFRLSEIVRISPETYRRLAPSIEGESIEIAGEQVAIIPENAVRIRQAILHMRSELQHNERLIKNLQVPEIVALKERLDESFQKMHHLAAIVLNDLERASLQGLINYSHSKLKGIAKTLSENPPIPRP